MNEDLDDVVKLEINYVGGVIHRWEGGDSCGSSILQHITCMAFKF